MRSVEFLTPSSSDVLKPGDIRSYLAKIDVQASEGLSFMNDESTPSSAVMMTFGSVALTLRSMPIPFPVQTAEYALERDPQKDVKAKKVEACKSFWLMNFLGDTSDRQTALEAAKLLTHISAAVAATTGATLIHWGSSSLLVTPTQLAKAMADIRERGMAQTLWVRPRFFQGHDSTPQRQTIGGYTQGLAEFVGREIEMEPAAGDPATVMGRLLKLTEWVMREGIFMKNGDTIGDETGSEKLRITFNENGPCSSGPILKVDDVSEAAS